MYETLSVRTEYSHAASKELRRLSEYIIRKNRNLKRRLKIPAAFGDHTVVSAFALHDIVMNLRILAGFNHFRIVNRVIPLESVKMMNLAKVAGVGRLFVGEIPDFIRCHAGGIGFITFKIKHDFKVMTGI